MYYVITVQDRIRVPPTKLGLPVEQAVKEAAAEQYERKVQPTLGMIVSVVSIDEIGEGIILPGDPAVHYECKLKMLVYKPELHELVNGEVIDNTEFGSFIRIGPFDGLVHISQLMDDFVSYDSKAAMFVGKESKRKLKEGDLVRARIISISLSPTEKKIGLTMRQSMLGSLTWIEEEKKKAKRG